jgi:hypothetical protein
MRPTVWTAGGAAWRWWRPVVREAIGKSLGEFIDCEAGFIGGKLLDHVCGHICCRWWRGRSLSVSPGAASVLAGTACIWTALAGRMGWAVAAEEFQRLGELILREFTVLVRVELLHEFRRHLGGIGWAALALRSAAGTAFVLAAAGRRGGAGILRRGVKCERGKG